MSTLYLLQNEKIQAMQWASKAIYLDPEDELAKKLLKSMDRS
tara:strand:+ start:436 stop:561 length:126 start_codon:yes stop_codon:yes gene_type:complete